VHFEDLVQFLERDMRMSHVYQPVMLRLLLGRNGRASVQDVARALLNEDRSQLEYYSEITKNMVGRVVANRAIVKRGGDYELLGYDRLTAEQVQELKAICDRKLAEYIARRGEAYLCAKSYAM
jgi:ATP adenylyltransferase